MIFVNKRGYPIIYFEKPYSYNSCPCEVCPCDQISCDISMVHLLNVWYPDTVDWDSEEEPVFWCDINGVSVPLKGGVDTRGLVYHTSKIYYQGALEKNEETGEWITTFYSWDEIQDGTAAIDPEKTLHCLRPLVQAESFFSTGANDDVQIYLSMLAEFSNYKEKMRLDLENLEQSTECYFNSLTVTLDVIPEDGDESVSTVRIQNITDKPVMSGEAQVLKGTPFPWNVSNFNYSGENHTELKKYQILKRKETDALVRDVCDPDWVDVTSYFRNYKELEDSTGVVTATIFYGLKYKARNGMNVGNFNSDEECVSGSVFGYLSDGTRCSDCPVGYEEDDEIKKEEDGGHAEVKSADPDIESGTEINTPEVDPNDNTSAEADPDMDFIPEDDPNPIVTPDVDPNDNTSAEADPDTVSITDNGNNTTATSTATVTDNDTTTTTTNTTVTDNTTGKTVKTNDVTVTDNSGNSVNTETVTDSSGNKTVKQDFIENTGGEASTSTTIVTNNNEGTAVTVIDSNGKTTATDISTTTDTNGNTITTITDNNGNTTVSTTDTNGNTTVTPNNNSSGTTATTTDSNGNTTVTTTTTDSNGGTTATTITTDGNGNTTVTTTTTDIDDNTTTVTVTTDRDGNTTISTNTTDADGNESGTKTKTDGGGNTSVITFKPNNNKANRSSKTKTMRFSYSGTVTEVNGTDVIKKTIWGSGTVTLNTTDESTEKTYSGTAIATAGGYKWERTNENFRPGEPYHATEEGTLIRDVNVGSVTWSYKEKSVEQASTITISVYPPGIGDYHTKHVIQIGDDYTNTWEDYGGACDFAACRATETVTYIGMGRPSSIPVGIFTFSL